MVETALYLAPWTITLIIFLLIYRFEPRRKIYWRHVWPGAVVAALLSSFRNEPIDPHTVVFGEVGLTGELRAVNFTRERLAEAARLEFKRAVIPERNRREQADLPAGIEVIGVSSVQELVECLIEH